MRSGTDTHSYSAIFCETSTRRKSPASARTGNLQAEIDLHGPALAVQTERAWNRNANARAAGTHSTMLSTDWTVQHYWLAAKFITNALFT